MLPSAVLLRNFRSFGGPTGVELKLRPLTLLFGLNNAGKSSLVRSLPLLADSLGSDGLDALNLEGRLKLFDLDFDSVRWKGRAETDEHTIGLTLRWDQDQESREIAWALREVDDWHRVVVESLSVRSDDGTPLLSADWQMMRGEEADHELTYDVRRGTAATSQRERIAFRGLKPQADDAAAAEVLQKLQNRLSAFASSVLWLRSLRPSPLRFTRWRGAMRWSLEPDGRDAAIVLAGESSVQEEVSAWYAKHLGFDLVVEESRKREVRTLLRNRDRASYDIDLIDSGEGLSECLPVLTALAMARQHREHGGPSVVAIEEPEAHLHPDLQRALAERACEVAREARPCIVLETHSEIILRTLQLQMVKRLLRPEDVILYWVRQIEGGRSVADPVELDEEGRFRGNWPPDAFLQDLELAAEVQDARDQREA
ncbi:MAG TPA: DUF3696 domain-containing protein [Candidatus Nanopelagicales bacterium]|nr:DUF3696 domain-containing protein [Candidatus Nanopelagicales bacterium]